jgi:acetoin:2,6-dichlorophenolindophenol oxidoreductase subunit beta
MRELTFSEALSEGLVQAMEHDESIFITGIAVDYPSGIFGSTVEATKRFGPARVFDAPAMENSLMGIAIGAAAVGKRPVIVHPRADFMFLAYDQLINMAAKWNYMFGGNAGYCPVVVRAVIGRGWGQGATHSQSLQSTIAHFPGITVAMPSFPDDAKGLMLSALQGTGPVVILEHRSLYATKGPVSAARDAIPFGKARIVRKGTDLTVVATSYMAYEAVHAAEELARAGISIEIVDPRTIRPLDEETILQSIKKTGRLVVADTSWELCGFASEVAALAAEKAFTYLKAPVRRIALPDCPAPVSQKLEQVFYPRASTIAAAVTAMLSIPAGDVSAMDRIETFKGPY